ncbi:MAG: response regulator, partial [Planctomycetes bacterium]|nr:response regulator [Planctomycetota bacterium]
MKTKIPGFQIKEELFKSNRTVIYRALREKEDTSVIIKTLNTEYPSNNEISRFKHESDITRKMDGEGVIQACEQIKYGNNLALILEDIKGVSLQNHLIQTEQIDLKSFLQMAIGISRGLGQVHRQNVIHKDINPSNIVLNRDTDKTQSVINLTFSVVDTGIGIPEDQQTNIFDAFEQVKGQSTERYGGTGLGLAITKRIVEAMDGRIILESEVGRGSTFNVEIKEIEVAAVAKLDTDSDEILDYNAVDFEPARVLIVDDVAYNRDLLTTYLEEYGFDLIEAANGQEAIENTRKHRPDLILLDMKMPVMDGFEMSEVLKNDVSLKDIPVVAVTAWALKEEKERIRKVCDGYLSKPVKREELIKKVMKYLPHTVKETDHVRKLEKVIRTSNEEIGERIAKLSKD